MQRSMSWAIVAILSLGLVACSGDDGVDGNDAGTEDAQSSDGGDNDSESDSDAGDTGADGNECEPLTCDDLDKSCGTVDNGCGDDLDCGECACDEATFLDDCPTRACEELVGCDSGECVYEPVETEDGLACTGCIGDDCEDSDVRYCAPEGGDSCPVAFCDPSPTNVDGEIQYVNEIITDHRYDCGLCDLGYQVCDGGSFECDDIEVAGVDPEFAECDSTQSGTTFIYVDSTYTGSDQDGSREAPFASLNEGIEQATQRNSEAVIVGGSAQYQETIELTSGISILGGFEPQPYWQRDVEQRPVISVGTDDIENELLVGIRAVDIVDTTELRNLDVETADVVDYSGVSTAALYAVNATGLRLIDVKLEAGAGGHGEDGTQGANATTAGADGEDGHDGESYGQQYQFSCEYLFTTELSTDAAPIPPIAAGGINSECPDANAGDGGRGDGKASDDSIGGIPDHETMHLPGENSAAGQCENPFGATSNPLYDPNNECGGRLFENNSSEYSDQNGRDGLAYPGPASAGSDGTLNITVDGTDFVLEGHGGDGADGGVGRGGGGGTSGHSRSHINTCWLAAGGGGGGAGGCGGEGGTGGDAGGWSLGIITHNSTGLELLHVEILASDGGNGGVGGSGGVGSSGGSGGIGGEATFAHDEFESGEGDGRRGGDGSDGQSGGDGGDGAGGSSIAIYCANNNTTITSEGDLDLTHGAGGLSSGDNGLATTDLDCSIE